MLDLDMTSAIRATYTELITMAWAIPYRPLEHGLKKYFFPTPYSDKCRLIKLSVLHQDDRSISTYTDAWVTLVEQGGKERHVSIPLRRLVEQDILATDEEYQYGLVFEPFRWDPQLSYVQAIKANKSPILFQATYIP